MNTTKPKDFISLDASECSTTYPVLIDNAERHFRVSELLSESNEFPNALAHLILGAEELIKAFFLMAVSKGLVLKYVKRYHKIFSNHATRHSFMKDFFSIWLAFTNIIAIDKKTISENSLWYGVKFVNKALRAALEASLNYQWWENADGLKQQCFYVDFDNALISPSNILESQYIEAKKHVTTFRNQFLILQLDLEDATELQLRELVTLLDDAGFKGLLEEMIERARTQS